MGLIIPHPRTTGVFEGLILFASSQNCNGSSCVSQRNLFTDTCCKYSAMCPAQKPVRSRKRCSLIKIGHSFPKEGERHKGYVLSLSSGFSVMTVLCLHQSVRSPLVTKVNLNLMLV